MRKKVPPTEKGHCKSPIPTELEREWRIRERSQQHNQPRLLNSSSAGFFLTTYTATTQATILFSHCNTLVSLNPAFSPSNPSVSQSIGKTCPTLCIPMDYMGALPGPSVHMIFQERILKWLAISSSKASFQPRDESVSPTCISCTGRQTLYHLNHLGNPTHRVVKFNYMTLLLWTFQRLTPLLLG